MIVMMNTVIWNAGAEENLAVTNDINDIRRADT
jgi:hypothetical protein